MEFWLSDDSTTLDLGDNVRKITLGGSEREYTIEKFARSNGGWIKGIGNYSPKKFSLTRDDFMESSSELHAWNARRNEFIKWATRESYEDIYLNMYYSTGASTDAIILRTLVYFTDIPEDEFEGSWATNFKRKYTLISPSGIWETTTEVTGSTAITSTNEQAVIITNGGNVACSPTFTFTPDGACSVFQVRIAEGYGFRLDGTFSTIAISYNMDTGNLTIGGAVVDYTNYLTMGTPFNFPVKSTYVYITASSGTFEWNFKQRYI